MTGVAEFSRAAVLDGLSAGGPDGLTTDELLHEWLLADSQAPSDEDVRAMMVKLSGLLSTLRNRGQIAALPKRESRISGRRSNVYVARGEIRQETDGPEADPADRLADLSIGDLVELLLAKPYAELVSEEAREHIARLRPLVEIVLP